MPTLTVFNRDCFRTPTDAIDRCGKAKPSMAILGRKSRPLWQNPVTFELDDFPTHRVSRRNSTTATS